MIDLHCHILPGIDDGPQDWEAALALARALADDGIAVVAATPHGAGSGHSLRYSAEQIIELSAELRQRLAAAGIALELVTGTELYLQPDLPERLRAGQALGYAGTRSVLLETPPDSLSSTLERAIFNLQVAGYRVILAHPERTIDVQHNPSRLRSLVDKGVLVQVTAASLAGLHGARLKATAEALLRAGLCHLLGSDAHTAAGHRRPAMRYARIAAAAIAGEEEATALVEGRPAAILRDEPINTPSPAPAAPARRRRWFPWG